jgi:steroid 5-alpha reductase family enzyme
VLIGLFYEHHPAAVSDPWRGATVAFLLLLWSARLTHSYFRR